VCTTLSFIPIYKTNKQNIYFIRIVFHLPVTFKKSHHQKNDLQGYSGAKMCVRKREKDETIFLKKKYIPNELLFDE